MKVLAISNFPSQFNENKLRPEFAKRGYLDVEFISSKKIQNLPKGNLSEHERIFLFCDMVGHSEYYQIRDQIKKSGRKLEILNRKSATWNVIKETNLMPPAKSVDPDSIPLLIKEFDLLKSQGATEAQYIKQLSKYWIARPLTNFNQLNAYVERYRKTMPKTAEPDRDSVPTGSGNDVTLNQEVSDSITPIKEEILREKSPAELKDEIKFLEEYNCECQTKLKNAEAQIALLVTEKGELNKKIQDLSLQIQKLPRRSETTPQAEQYKTMLISIKALVDLKVMTADEALDKLLKGMMLLEM